MSLSRILASLALASSLHAADNNMGITLGLNNKVGIGTFLPRDQAQNKLVSTLGFTPYIMTGPLYGDKRVKLSFEGNLDMQWLQPQGAKPQFGTNDFMLRAAIKNALQWPEAHLTLTPTIETELPFSQSAADVHKIVGLGVNTALVWSLGSFSLSYKPSLAAYVYGSSSEAQTLATIKNTLLSTYALNNHSFNVALRSYHSFLRNQPENLKISTLGYIEYIYMLPTALPFTLTVGVSSLQPLRNAQGGINFPFYDFFTPANNYSQIYCGIETLIS